MNQDISRPSVRPFIGQDFLLTNDYALALYHDYARDLPIIDYHNHLPPDQIAANTTFENITQVWLQGDHYKWRAMRTNGVSEEFITGQASDKEKFQKWAETVPYTMRNPLYHWTHLELQRYFGIVDLLDGRNAAEIYAHTSDVLGSGQSNVHDLLHKMKVEVLCSTDDPTDDLKDHISFAQAKDTSFQLFPSFRPDKMVQIEREDFVDYIGRLGVVADVEVTNWTSLLDAIDRRMAFFHSHGCRLSDHGLEQMYAVPFTDAAANRILQKRLSGAIVDRSETVVYKSALLHCLSTRYHTKGWVQQFHLGALRNNNHRMFHSLGPDTGWDSIGDFSQAKQLATFLDRLDANNQLTRTIIYNLNPADNEVMATMIGNYNDGSVAGKMQWGSAWWFLDQMDGMEKQLNTLSNMGLLSRFIGMLTDSRSFLSFPRHEYFRRLLCRLLGQDIEQGLLPVDIPWIGQLVQDICYNNARKYFRFEEQMFK
ncbi:MAG: glucuronate isomerase [Bacteroidota bacterium]